MKKRIPKRSEDLFRVTQLKRAEQGCQPRPVWRHHSLPHPHRGPGSPSSTAVASGGGRKAFLWRTGLCIGPPGQGQGREEAWVPVVRDRNRKQSRRVPELSQRALSTLILEPVSLPHSSCQIVHPAVPNMCQASFTRHQKCGDYKIIANIYEVLTTFQGPL